MDLTGAPLMRLAMAAADRRRGHAGVDLAPRAARRLEHRRRSSPRCASSTRRSPTAAPWPPARAPAVPGLPALAAASRTRSAAERALAATSWPGFGARPRCRTTGRPAEAHRAESGALVRLELPRDVSARLRETARSARADRQHGGAGRVGAAAVPVQRRAGRGVRHHGLRPPGRAAGRRVDGRHVHQHRADPGRGRRRPRRGARGCATSRPQQSESRRFDFVSLARIQVLSDLPAGRGAVRQHGRVRELPVRRGRGGRRGHRASGEVRRRGRHQLPAVPARLPRRPARRSSSPTTRRCSTRRRSERAAATCGTLLDRASPTAPAAPLDDLPLLTDAERHRVLRGVERHRPSAARRGSLAELFARAGRAAPRTRSRVVDGRRGR